MSPILPATVCTHQKRRESRRAEERTGPSRRLAAFSFVDFPGVALAENEQEGVACTDRDTVLRHLRKKCPCLFPIAPIECDHAFDQDLPSGKQRTALMIALNSEASAGGNPAASSQLGNASTKASATAARSRSSSATVMSV